MGRGSGGRLRYIHTYSGSRWSSSGTGQDGQGEAKGGDSDDDGDDDDDDDDDKSESNETLSFSYHTRQRYYCCNWTALLRARTTRQLVSLHVCTNNRPATTMAAAVRSHWASQDRRHYALASHGTHAFASARVLDL